MAACLLTAASRRDVAPGDAAGNARDHQPADHHAGRRRSRHRLGPLQDDNPERHRDTADRRSQQRFDHRRRRPVPPRARLQALFEQALLGRSRRTCTAVALTRQRPRRNRCTDPRNMRVCCMGQKATNVVYDLVALVAAVAMETD